jgi:hypothetical protein
MISPKDTSINKIIFKEIEATSAFVAILKHHGKLSVPRESLMSLVTEKQIWPNDFIYKNGNAMLITYDKDSDSIGFELKYNSKEGIFADNELGYKCTRNQTEVGFVDHDSPLYKD